MDQAIASLLGAFIGASAAIGGGLSLEAFKRRRDRHGIAMALAGAIEHELWAIRRRGHVAMFESMLPLLDDGVLPTFFGFVREEDARNRIADAYLDKLGALSGELPSHVIRFIQTMWGLRVDASRLGTGKFGDDPKLIARIIRQDLELMAEMDIFGTDLVRRLKLSAGYGRVGGLSCLKHIRIGRTRRPAP